jgi:hypothetical protein
MSLAQRVHHQPSRRQLFREALYSYVVAFVVIFLDLRFVGIKHYYPSFHREPLPLNAAAIQALLWAFIGLVVWMLHEHVLLQSEQWRSYWSLDWQIQRLVLGGAVVVITATIFAWRWILPLWGLAAAVA